MREGSGRESTQGSWTPQSGPLLAPPILAGHHGNLDKSAPGK